MIHSLMIAASNSLAPFPLLAGIGDVPAWAIGVFVVLIGLPLLSRLRYIPNNRVGVVEKLWSLKGSVTEGRILALHGEAGLQADLLRGGIHFGYWAWQYRIHKTPLLRRPRNAQNTPGS